MYWDTWIYSVYVNVLAWGYASLLWVNKPLKARINAVISAELLILAKPFHFTKYFRHVNSLRLVKLTNFISRRQEPSRGKEYQSAHIHYHFTIFVSYSSLFNKGFISQGNSFLLNSFKTFTIIRCEVITIWNLLPLTHLWLLLY